MEHLFPRIHVQTCAQMHSRVKLLEEMQVKTILKLLGGMQDKLLGQKLSISYGLYVYIRWQKLN